MTESAFPPGWDQDRVKRVLDHYEQQTDDQAIAEDEAAFEVTTHAAISIPVELLPAVRDLLAGNQPHS